MGYLVETSGRIRLTEQAEREALTVLEVELPPLGGWFRGEDVDTLDDLAGFVGATLRREGDDVFVTTDEQGDPKWSEQATAFYRGLARWVTDGEVHFRGEDEAIWSYRYTPEGFQQVGVNGWDGTGDGPGVPPTPPGPPPDAATERMDRIPYPSPGGPGPAHPSPPPPPPAYEQPQQPSPPPYPGPGPYGAPPPVGGAPGVPPSSGTPWPYDASAWEDHPARPRSGARTAGMVLLLIVGIILIIGIASLGAGLG